MKNHVNIIGTTTTTMGITGNPVRREGCKI
jgi:hypothetical protein